MKKYIVISLLLFLNVVPFVSAHEASTAAMFSQIQRLNQEISKIQKLLHETNEKLQAAVKRNANLAQDNKKQAAQLLAGQRKTTKVQGKALSRISKLEKRKSVPKGAILLMTKNVGCPRGTKQASRFAIQVDRRQKTYKNAYNLRNGNTDWDISRNYDGLLYRTCIF